MTEPLKQPSLTSSRAPQAAVPLLIPSPSPPSRSSEETASLSGVIRGWGVGILEMQGQLPFGCACLPVHGS
jgi:hypothetical protein